jgi:hypothetical protein
LFFVLCSLLTLLRGYIRHHSSGISHQPRSGYLLQLKLPRSGTLNNEDIFLKAIVL